MNFPQFADGLHTATDPDVNLSIIFVNWNSVDYLRDCLVSIYQYTRDVRFEIIVVDNASPERGVEGLKEQFPNITVIESPENVGFARANNLGFGRSSGSHVLFLNPDTQLLGPAISIMLMNLVSLSQAGIVGCKLLNTDLSVQTSCIQKFPTAFNQVTDIEYFRLRWPHCWLWGIGPLFTNNHQPVKVEVVTGACMMMKREIIEKIGLFSEEYFMYAEDLDLCYKATKAGFVNYYVGDATVIHHGGKSTDRREANEWATRMKFKAILQFLRKTRGTYYCGMFRLAMGLAAVLRLLIVVLIIPFLGTKAFLPVITKWRTILASVAVTNSLPLKNSRKG